jgi:hypothetical protein
MLVQQAVRATVDTPTTKECASLTTSRWCWSRDCRRRVTPGCCCSCYCCQSCLCHCYCLPPSPCPYRFLCHHCWGWGWQGQGRQRTRQFLLRWAQWLLLLWRTPSSLGREVEHGGLSLATELSNSISSSSRSLQTMWKEGNSYDCLMKIFM